VVEKESIAKLEYEKEIISNIENMIEDNLLFKGNQIEAKKNIKKLRKGKWRDKGWAKITLAAGFVN